MDDLAVDVERDLARREDPQGRRRVEQADRKGGRRVPDVLAVVEDENRRRGAEPFEERRLPAAHAERGDRRVHDFVRGRRRLEPHEPHGAGQRARGCDRDGRLADAAGADDLDETVAPDQLRELRDLVVATDEVGLQRRQVAGRRRPQRRVVLQDLELELLQARAGLEPELVGERGAHPLIGRQRVALATRAVEGRDQQLPQSLAIGVGRDGGFELGDDRFPEPQPCGEVRVQELGARLLELHAVRRRPVAGRGEQLTAEAPEGRGADLARAVLVTSVEAPRRGRRIAQDAQRVDLAGLRREPVGAVDHRGIGQSAPQPGDLGLERVPLDGGAAPEVVEQPVGAHRGPRVERQPHQQLRRLPARYSHRLVVTPDLDRSEHGELQHLASLRPRQRAVSEVSAVVAMVAAMPATTLLHQLVVGDAAAVSAIVEASRDSDDPAILVAASLFAPDAERLLARADTFAATTRDRQLVAIAIAHRRRDGELVDALARDHLVDHPDNVLVAWIADANHHQSTSDKERP